MFWKPLTGHQHQRRKAESSLREGNKCWSQLKQYKTPSMLIATSCTPSFFHCMAWQENVCWVWGTNVITIFASPWNFQVGILCEEMIHLVWVSPRTEASWHGFKQCCPELGCSDSVFPTRGSLLPSLSTSAARHSTAFGFSSQAPFHIKTRMKWFLPWGPGWMPEQWVRNVTYPMIP